MGKPRDLANVVATGNILADGAVAPAELTGVTSTAAEINILDGVTATAAELNLLDGVTATTAELNHVDGVTSNVQTQMDTKAPVASPTFTGTATAPTINASTALQIGGTAITATAAELNKMDGVTVSASDINSVTTKAPIDGATFTGTTTIPTADINGGAIDGAVIGANSAVAGTFTDVTATGTTTITTADINGGAIDGAVIGANSAAAVTATTVNASTKLQVNGTDVITNARQLSNIASVDSTTLATLNSAGLGGGGGAFDMTASGAISAGDALALNSNGTVTKIGSVAGHTDPPEQLATASAFTSTSQMLELSYDTGHDKYVCAFTQSGSAKVFAGTIGTSSPHTPVVGTDALIESKNVNAGIQVLYDSAGSNKHIVIYSYYEGDSDTNCRSAVVDVSGSTPSVSSLTNWNSNLRANNFSSCYDADNANVVVAWQADGGENYIRAGTVSSGTVSWGNRLNFLSGGVTPVVEYDPDTNQVILMFSTGGATRVIFYTLSGTTLTQLTEQSSNKLQHSSSDITTTYHFLRYEPHNNKLLISYQDNTNGGMYIQAATIGSNSITYGTRVEVSAGGSLDTASGSRGSKIALKNDTSGVFYIAYGTNQPRKRIRTASLSGTTVTMESADYSYSSKQAHDIVFDPDTNVLIQATKQSSSNMLQIHTNKVITNTPPADAFIGFAGENISNAASGEVKLIGSVVTGLSGLTTGSNMYVTDSATFSTSSTNNTLVGKALSTSSLLITRPN